MPKGVYDRKKKPAAGKVSRRALTKNDSTPSSEGEVLQLDEMSLMKLRLLDAEVRAANAELSAQRNAKESLMAKLDPSGILNAISQRIRASAAKVDEGVKKYEEFREQIGKKFGIDMKNYAYDDETGILRDLNEEAVAAELRAEETIPTPSSPSV